MPEHPDDAPKRQQRGVLPPFFAPRSGRGDGPPAPASGSWRRVSRLFTPPDVAKQHRPAATPPKPFTPPSTPTMETAAATGATEGANALQPHAEPEAGTYTPTPVATPALSPVATPLLTPAPMPVAPGFPFDFAEPAEARSFDEIAWPTPEDAETAGEQPPSAVPGELATEGAGEILVESLEQEPISLAMPNSITTGADTGIQPLDGDTFPDSFSALSHSEVDHGLEDGAPMEHAPPLPPVDESWGAGGVASFHDSREAVDVAPAQQAGSAWDEPSAPATSESDERAIDSVQSVNDVRSAEDGAVPMRGGTSAMPAGSDPWADIELTEPALGTSGWPPPESEAGVPDEWRVPRTDSELSSAIGGEVSVDSIDSGSDAVGGEGEDEMTAALAWSDAPHRDQEAVLGGADGVASRGEDTFSAVAHELRDSSSAWGTIDDGSMHSEPDSIEPPAASEGVGGASGAASTSFQTVRGDVATDAEAGRESAIADALARVAERIRAGEVELSSEAAGASDESALAAALAALLRRPRRD